MIAFGAVGMVLVAAWIWVLGQQRPAPEAAAWPTAETLDSLSRYLVPVAAAPPIDEYAVYLPAASISRAEAPAMVAEAPVLEAAAWRVSAILITDRRRLAIINDRPVRVGDRLENGARVAAIERDHVIIKGSRGTRYTLHPTVGEEPGV
jgi:hypothetical protein